MKHRCRITRLLLIVGLSAGSVAATAQASIQKSGAAHAVEANLTVQDVRTSFAKAGVKLDGFTHGPFRVVKHGFGSSGCSALRTKDGNIVITICRHVANTIVLFMTIPAGPVRDFRSIKQELLFVKSRQGRAAIARGVTLQLVLQCRNVTLTYLGANIQRLQRIGRAIAMLKKSR